MRVLNDLLIENTTPIALSLTSPPQDLTHMMGWDLTAKIVAANASNKTFATGTFEVQTLTFPSKAGAADGDYIVLSGEAGVTWAVALDTTGGAANTPTGAAWLAATHSVYLDISAATTAADVAAAVEVALNLLTGFTAAITTNDTAANGTMILTQTVPGPTTNPDPHNKNDSGVGTILGVQTTAGVLGNVDLVNNVVTITAHGFTTGEKTQLTTTGTLPTGVTTGTDYYLIAVDADTLGFAISQANALLGTKIDLTGYGAGTHTVAIVTTLAGSIKLQKTNDPATIESPEWFDIGSSSQAFSGATTLNWTGVDVAYRALRAVVTVTSGEVTVAARINAKGV